VEQMLCLPGTREAQMRIFYLTVLGIAVLFWSCTTRTTLEGPVAIRASADGSQPAAPTHVHSSPTTAVEVNDALHRIFAGAVIATSQGHSFTTGDFNGDGSDDLAVLVHPTDSKLKTLNHPLANWTIQDATQAFVPPPSQRVIFLPPKPEPQSARSKELLLAVIHGYGPNGWRDSNSQQAYLVRHAGSGPIETRPAPDRVEGAPVSIAHSAIIFEPSGTPGFLFWTGSQYAWRRASSN